MVLGVSGGPVVVGGATAAQYPHNERQQRAATSHLARHSHTPEDLFPGADFPIRVIPHPLSSRRVIFLVTSEQL